MDPAATFNHNRDALQRIIAALCALVGLVPGRMVERVERAIRQEVLRVLRPAEAAVRRLIFVAAHGLVLKPRPPRLMPRELRQSLRRRPKATARAPVFQLADPRPPMLTPVKRGRYVTGVGPRIRSFDGFEPTVMAIWAAQSAPVRQVPAPKPDREVTRTSALLRRLQAISDALDNIPAQARRLARWAARRQRLSEKRLVYTSPLCIGAPPSLRREPVEEIEHILTSCHALAFDIRQAARAADSS